MQMITWRRNGLLRNIPLSPAAARIAKTPSDVIQRPLHSNKEIPGDRMNMTEATQVRVYADTSGIVPFWARIPQFFLYPFRLTPLVVMGCCMLGIWIGHWLPLGFLIAGFAWLVFLRYAYSVLD